MGATRSVSFETTENPAGLHGVLRCSQSADLAFRDQLPNFWNEINWNFDRRVCGILKCSFVLGHGFFVALRFVVFEYLLDLIPPGRKMFQGEAAAARFELSVAIEQFTNNFPPNTD